MLKITRLSQTTPQGKSQVSLGVADILLPRDARIVSLDIERAPMLVESWGLFNQNHHIGQIVRPSRMVSWAATTVGEEEDPSFRSVWHDSETKMLNDLWALLDRADMVIGWNSKGFDIKHIQTEFDKAGLGPPSSYRQTDLLLLARRLFKYDSNKLDYVAQAKKLGKKLDYGESHSELLRGCEAGNPESLQRFRDYNIQDTLLPVRLYQDWKEQGWM